MTHWRPSAVTDVCVNSVSNERTASFGSFGSIPISIGEVAKYVAHHCDFFDVRINESLLVGNAPGAPFLLQTSVTVTGLQLFFDHLRALICSASDAAAW